jgi:hypothetical protein
MWDLEKAFNSAPHLNMERVLQKYGFHPSAISIFKDMYAHAEERPLVNGFSLRGGHTRRGVRQGCPASPTLFLLFFDAVIRHISEAVSTFPDTSLHAFVDDLGLLSPHPEAHAAMLACFNRVAVPLGLRLSPHKSVIQSLGSQAQFSIQDSGYRMSTMKGGIPRDVSKYLGVWTFSKGDEGLLNTLILNEVNEFFLSIPRDVLSCKLLTKIVNC